MGRRIVWSVDEANKANESEERVDAYFDRLLKYIPSDVVGTWLAGSGVIQSNAQGGSRAGLLWLLFVVGLVLSFFWTRKQTMEPGKPTAWQQIVLSCVAFVVWVFAIGGPFAEWSLYQPWYGSLLLIVYAATIPLISPPPSAQ
jgi:hypothetical protein